MAAAKSSLSSAGAIAARADVSAANSAFSAG